MNAPSFRNPLVVSAGGKGLPFSKGILTLSLLAIGLEPDEAYALSHDMQHELAARRLTRLPKADLVQSVHARLLQRHGAEVASRYAEWRDAPLAIYITDHGRRYPFSKGVLAQSLAACGLDLALAHDAAATIEQRLIGEGLDAIERKELRRITHRILNEDFGPRYASRYLLWSKLRKPNRPLVILVGGATGSGKSTVAVELAHRLGIARTITTDSVRQIMRLMLSPGLVPSIHCSSYEAWDDEHEGGEPTRDEVVQAFRQQASKVMVGVRALIQRAVNENDSIIVDGVHLVPGRIRSEEYPEALMVGLVVATSDEQMHRDRFQIRQGQAHSRLSSKYLRYFSAIRSIQGYLVDRAYKAAWPVIENMNLDETVLAALQLLTEQFGGQLRQAAEWEPQAPPATDGAP